MRIRNYSVCKAAFKRVKKAGKTLKRYQIFFDTLERSFKNRKYIKNENRGLFFQEKQSVYKILAKDRLMTKCFNFNRKC